MKWINRQWNCKECASCVFAKLAGLTSRAMFSPLTDVLSKVKLSTIILVDDLLLGCDIPWK